MLVGTKIKQPDEVLDYDFDYTEWFSGDGDFVASAEVTATPNDLTVNYVITNENIVKVWVQGGTEGEYLVELTMTTDAGRVKQDELTIIVQEF